MARKIRKLKIEYLITEFPHTNKGKWCYKQSRFLMSLLAEQGNRLSWGEFMKARGMQLLKKHAQRKWICWGLLASHWQQLLQVLRVLRAASSVHSKPSKWVWVVVPGSRYKSWLMLPTRLRRLMSLCQARSYRRIQLCQQSARNNYRQKCLQSWENAFSTTWSGIC